MGNLRNMFGRGEPSKIQTELKDTPLSSFEAFDSMFGAHSTLSPLLSRIHDDFNKLGSRSLKIFTQLPFFLPAVHEGCNFLETHGSDPIAIKKLSTRAIHDSERYVKAILLNDPATCNDISRDLMEIEALILDFALEPKRMKLWLDQNQSIAKDFAFGTMNKRFKKAVNIPKEYATPSYSEYMMHSENLHARPNARNLTSGNVDQDLYVLCIELSEHLLRVITALILFIVRGEQDDSIADALRKEHPQLDYIRGLSHQFFAQATAGLSELGMTFPDRTLYRIQDFPTGIRITTSEESIQDMNSNSEIGPN